MTAGVRAGFIRLRLWLPLGAADKLIYCAAVRQAKEAGAELSLTKEGKKLLHRKIKEARRQFKGLRLLEVETEDFSVWIKF